MSYVESSQCFFQAHHQRQVPGSCGLRPGSAISGRSEKEDRKRGGRTLPRCCSSPGSQVQLYASTCRSPITSLPLCIVSRGSCARRHRAVMKRATAGAGGAWARRRAAAGGLVETRWRDAHKPARPELRALLQPTTLPCSSHARLPKKKPALVLLLTLKGPQAYTSFPGKMLYLAL